VKTSSTPVVSCRNAERLWNPNAMGRKCLVSAADGTSQKAATTKATATSGVRVHGRVSRSHATPTPPSAQRTPSAGRRKRAWDGTVARQTAMKTTAPAKSTRFRHARVLKSASGAARKIAVPM